MFKKLLIVMTLCFIATLPAKAGLIIDQDNSITVTNFGTTFSLASSSVNFFVPLMLDGDENGIFSEREETGDDNFLAFGTSLFSTENGSYSFDTVLHQSNISGVTFLQDAFFGSYVIETFTDNLIEAFGFGTYILDGFEIDVGFNLIGQNVGAQSMWTNHIGLLANEPAPVVGVPEPGTMVLFAGVFAFAFMRKKNIQLVPNKLRA